MCIIVFKPSNQAFPSKDIMKNCFDNNPDGAGYMFPDYKNKRVVIRKGFMEWDAFAKEYDKIAATSCKRPFIFHFRIGTHGARDAGMTHPFPLGKEKEEYRLLTNTADIAFVHNGIFSFLPAHKEYSDSVLFGKKILEPLAEKWPETFIGNGAESILLATLGSSKVAVMRADGGVEYFGYWEKDGNILYSNTTYKTVRYNYPTYSYTRTGTNDAWEREEWDSEGCFPSTDGKNIPLLSEHTEKIPNRIFAEATRAAQLIKLKAGDVWHGEKGDYDDSLIDPVFGPMIAKLDNTIFLLDDLENVWEACDRLLK